MTDRTNGYAPDAAPLGDVGQVGVGGIEPASGLSKAGLAVQMMGAAMSLALVAGGAVWGYKLIVRDATGVPVVSAMSGPMREAPADPGGEVALHTGLSVNAVAAMGEAAPPEEVLLLAPATADLTDEDLQVMPMAEAEEYHPAAIANAAPSEEETPAETAPQAAPALAASDTDQPLSAEDVLALADAIAAGATPLTALSDTPIAAAVPEGPMPDAVPEDVAGAASDGTTGIADAPEAAAAALVADAVAAAVQEATAAPDVPLTDAGAPADEAIDSGPETMTLARLDPDGRLLRSLRPPPRPDGIAARASAPEGTRTGTEQSAPTAAEGFAVSAASVPVGTTLVQLGAFDTPDLAGAEWLRLSDRFAEFMTGKDHLIQEASSGGRAFYRLRATGFVDIADARRFCSALVAEDAACIPVVVQ